MRLRFALTCCFVICATALLADYPEEQKHYWEVVKPIFDQKCNRACHNADDNKGGLNLNQFDFILSIQKRGDVFLKVIEHVENETMPPEGKPQLTLQEKDTLLFYVRKYIKDALEKPDPGLITARRLSNQEYEYAIEDLTGVIINTDSLLPRDPGGGEGFDNFSGTLYITPLLMERYFELSEQVVELMQDNEALWRRHVPDNKFSWWQKLRHWWHSLVMNEDLAYQQTVQNAQKGIVSFATLAYRRYLNGDERAQLLDFFEQVYQSLPENAESFDRAMQEVLKAVLVSHHFLIRQEADPPLAEPYLVGNFELATRISSFLWCSIPDLELLEAAYKGDLRRPELVRLQVRRMLEDPKSKRMAESFVTQWLEIDNIVQPEFEMDPALFPNFNQELRTAMYRETVEYFNYTLSDSRNFLELLTGDYTFLNESLAQHYGIANIQGDSLRRVQLNTPERGGILGMASVLTATSLPNRTSPVLRGKWVMEKILSSPPKPPPPNVPDLEATKEIHDELTLRQALELHRKDPACSGCHQDMDDLGFALENFDAVGRWRATYNNSPVEIDVRGRLKSGEEFEGTIELKHILNTRQQQFAKGISRKMLGFALGRSVVFKDTKTVNELAETLIDKHFDPVPFIEEIVLSYPFQYKKTDKVIVDRNVGNKVI